MSDLIPIDHDPTEEFLHTIEAVQDKLNAVRLAKEREDEPAFWQALTELDQAIEALPQAAAIVHATIEGLRKSVQWANRDAEQAYFDGYRDGAADILNGGYIDGESVYEEDVDAPLWIAGVGDNRDEQGE